MFRDELCYFVGCQSSGFGCDINKSPVGVGFALDTFCEWPLRLLSVRVDDSVVVVVVIGGKWWRKVN